MITIVDTACNPRFARNALTLVSMNTLGNRIQKALDDLTEATGRKHTANWLSVQIGVSRTAVYKWMNNPTAGIDGDNLLMASRALRVSPEWLQTGRDAGPVSSDSPEASYIYASSPEDLAAKLSEKGNEDIAKIIQLLLANKDKISGH